MSVRTSVAELRPRKSGDIEYGCHRTDPMWSPADDPLFPTLLLGTTCSFDPGQTIFNEGDDARCFYKIVKGSVRLSKTSSAGYRQVIRFAMGDAFLGLENGPKHSLTAEALRATEVVRVNRGDVECAGEGVHAQLLWLAFAELAEIQDHLVMLVGKNARARVATFLLRTFRSGRITGDSRIFIPASRLDLADYLGLTVETVCRELGSLKRRSIIDVPNRHEIVLKDVPALQAISAGRRR